MVRNPTQENQGSYARATYLLLRSKSLFRSWSEKASDFLPTLESLAQDGTSSDTTFRQLKMETLMALGKLTEMIAEYEKSPSGVESVASRHSL